MPATPIIDVHYHWVPEVPDAVVPLLAKDIEYGRRRRGEPADAVTLERIARETLIDPDGRLILRRNAELGISVTCLNLVDIPLPGLDAEAVLRVNRRAADLAAMHPDQLRAFAGIDPRRPEAPEIAKTCLESFGMVGIKWHPDHGYDVTSPEAYAVLAVLERCGGILLTHTGSLPGGRYRLASLERIADVLVDFPGLRVIAAHMGKTAWHEWAGLAHDFPNLYGDLAVWSRYGDRSHAFLCRQLRELTWVAGVEKVLWGSDDPFENHTVPTRRFLEMLRDFVTRAPAGYEFSQEEVDLMLGGNAARLLGID